MQVFGINFFNHDKFLSQKRSQAAETVSTKEEAPSDVSYVSKEAAEALKSVAIARPIEHESIGTMMSVEGDVGKMFPEIDSRPIAKRYLAVKNEAQEKAKATAEKLDKFIKESDYSPIQDEEGNKIAIFKNVHGKMSRTFPYNVGNLSGGDSHYSHAMIEFDPVTKKPCAITKIYNFNANGDRKWNKDYIIWAERYDFNEDLSDINYMKMALPFNEYTYAANGEVVLTPKIKTYAKGFIPVQKRDEDIKADKMISSSLLGVDTLYDSYKENVSMPYSLFSAAEVEFDPGDINNHPEELLTKFSGAIEYPIYQMQYDDSYARLMPAYINEQGNI